MRRSLLARERGFDGIICGHLHHPVIERHGDVLYCNDGDWVENCSALMEDADGQLHLIKAVGSVTDAKAMVIAAI